MSESIFLTNSIRLALISNRANSELENIKQLLCAELALLHWESIWTLAPIHDMYADRTAPSITVKPFKIFDPDLVIIDSHSVKEIDWLSISELSHPAILMLGNNHNHWNVEGNNPLVDCIPSFLNSENQLQQWNDLKQEIVIRILRLLKIRHLFISTQKLEYELAKREADQSAGRHVQLTLFPDTDQCIQRLAFSYSILPSMHLSGDFIDYFAIDEYRVGFYLADVAGHGCSSAFVTLMIKNYMDRLRRRFDHGSDNVLLRPDATLASVSQELIALNMGRHLAMVYGVIDTSSQSLRYALGAHYPPPLLMKEENANCTVIPLEGRGLPLGVFPDASFNVIEIQLPTDFLLMIASDGLMEVVKGNSLDEKLVLIQKWLVDGTHSPSAMLQRLDLPKDAPLPDDLAILMIRSSIPVANEN